MKKTRGQILNKCDTCGTDLDTTQQDNLISACKIAFPFIYVKSEGGRKASDLLRKAIIEAGGNI